MTIGKSKQQTVMISDEINSSRISEEEKKFIKASSTQILQGNTTVKTFELEQTGLGYYINPKPKETISILHETDLFDWYVPFHLPSRRSFGVIFFDESQACRFVRELAIHLDWLGEVESLEKQDNWQNIGSVIQRLRDSIDPA